MPATPKVTSRAIIGDVDTIRFDRSFDFREVNFKEFYDKAVTDRLSERVENAVVTVGTNHYTLHTLCSVWFIHAIDQVIQMIHLYLRGYIVYQSEV